MNGIYTKEWHVRAVYRCTKNGKDKKKLKSRIWDNKEKSDGWKEITSTYCYSYNEKENIYTFFSASSIIIGSLKINWYPSIYEISIKVSSPWDLLNNAHFI